MNTPPPPRPKNVKPPKIYKVIINSNDRISGTIDNGLYRVCLPRSPKSNKCQLFVEFFAYEDESNSAATDLDRFVYHVHVSDISQPDTYYTKTNSTTNILLTNKGREYLADITDETLGISLSDKRVFETNNINIFLSSNNIATNTLASRDWTLVLLIREYDE
jgi:hypothetical protein